MWLQAASRRARAPVTPQQDPQRSADSASQVGSTVVGETQAAQAQGKAQNALLPVPSPLPALSTALPPAMLPNSPNLLPFRSVASDASAAPPSPKKVPRKRARKLTLSTASSPRTTKGSGGVSAPVDHTPSSIDSSSDFTARHAAAAARALVTSTLAWTREAHSVCLNTLRSDLPVSCETSQRAAAHGAQTSDAHSSASVAHLARAAALAVSMISGSGAHGGRVCRDSGAGPLATSSSQRLPGEDFPCDVGGGRWSAAEGAVGRVFGMEVLKAVGVLTSACGGAGDGGWRGIRTVSTKDQLEAAVSTVVANVTVQIHAIVGDCVDAGTVSLSCVRDFTSAVGCGGGLDPARGRVGQRSTGHDEEGGMSTQPQCVAAQHRRFDDGPVGLGGGGEDGASGSVAHLRKAQQLWDAAMQLLRLLLGELSIGSGGVVAVRGGECGGGSHRRTCEMDCSRSDWTSMSMIPANGGARQSGDAPVPCRRCCAAFAAFCVAKAITHVALAPSGEAAAVCSCGFVVAAASLSGTSTTTLSSVGGVRGDVRGRCEHAIGGSTVARGGSPSGRGGRALTLWKPFSLQVLRCAVSSSLVDWGGRGCVGLLFMIQSALVERSCEREVREGRRRGEGDASDFSCSFATLLAEGVRCVPAVDPIARTTTRYGDACTAVLRAAAQVAHQEYSISVHGGGWGML